MYHTEDDQTELGLKTAKNDNTILTDLQKYQQSIKDEIMDKVTQIDESQP